MSSTVKLDARLVFSLDFELNPPMVVGSRIIYGFSGKASGGTRGRRLGRRYLGGRQGGHLRRFLRADVCEQWGIVLGLELRRQKLGNPPNREAMTAK